MFFCDQFYVLEHSNLHNTNTNTTTPSCKILKTFKTNEFPTEDSFCFSEEMVDQQPDFFTGGIPEVYFGWQ